jgi:hypothetical protein
MRQPPPKWTLEALSIVLRDKLRTEHTRGKYGNYSARYRQRQIDKVRWSAVVYIREISNEVRTWEDAYHEAANLLGPTIATGSPERMKASYQSWAAKLRKMDMSPEQRLEFARDYFESRHDMLREGEAA